MSDKHYLGDGVYARVDDYGTLVLTTEDGYEATNTIYLEAEVWRELRRFISSKNDWKHFR